jgi:tRNA pseudouridine38-40 synthase
VVLTLRNRKHLNSLRRLTDISHFALGIAYRGSAFHGYQYQGENIPTVQKALESALSVIADETVQVTCAGRTDTGVHATKQVVNFQTTRERSEKAWVMGTNAHLPDDVSVTWAREVGPDFNARHSAVARRYCYVIYNNRARSALFAGHYTRDPRQIEVSAMHEAAQSLLGENDFTSFRASSCQSRTPNRNIHHINVRRNGDMIVIDIQANAFLHHMVRNIAGVLLDIGAGAKPTSWSGELLLAKNRSLGSVTAPPDGLYLVDVLYPEFSMIPQGPDLPHFLQGLI